MPVQVREFKGHPVIDIVENDANGIPRHFCFGLKKAKQILEHLDDIKVFVQANSGK